MPNDDVLEEIRKFNERVSMLPPPEEWQKAQDRIAALEDDIGPIGEMPELISLAAKIEQENITLARRLEQFEQENARIRERLDALEQNGLSHGKRHKVEDSAIPRASSTRQRSKRPGTVEAG